MPCIKIVDKPYENYTDTYHLIHKYIFPKSKYIGGLAVDPVYAAEQMDFCRHIWGKNTGVKLRHFILTYSEYETNNLMTAELLHYDAYEICNLYEDDYQIVFGIHDKPDQLHVHFVMNTVSYRDGHKYRRNKHDDYELGVFVSSLSDQYVPIYYD